MNVYTRALAQISFLFALMIGASWVAEVRAQAAPTSPQAQSITASELEQSKFAFHKSIEMQKLDVERAKAWWTGASIVIPLFLGVLTLLWQSRSALALKKKDASDMFQLKAAELVLAGATPAAARNRALALKALFPQFLPEGFAASFDFSKLPGIRSERKLELLKMLVEHPDHSAQVVALWRTLFPEEDEWLKRLDGTFTDLGAR